MRSLTGVMLVVTLTGCSGGAPDQVKASYDTTGKLRLLTYDANGNGRTDAWSYMDGARVVRVEIDADEDGRIERWEYYEGDKKLVKVGTSRVNDGKVDTWSYPPVGTIVRVEISAKRDGKVTRTEFYDADVLVRAEEDSDGNGAVDKWETFRNGMVSSVAFDTEGVGRPTRRLEYDDKGQARVVDPSPPAAARGSK